MTPISLEESLAWILDFPRWWTDKGRFLTLPALWQIAAKLVWSAAALATEHANEGKRRAVAQIPCDCFRNG
jgi:hypothetical protein